MLVSEFVFLRAEILRLSMTFHSKKLLTNIIHGIFIYLRIIRFKIIVLPLHTYHSHALAFPYDISFILVRLVPVSYYRNNKLNLFPH